MPYWFDGNNVAAISSSDGPGGRRKRRDLLEHLSTLRKERGGRFVVYFDGDDVDRRNPPEGVAVRFAAPLSADAAILEQLRGAARAHEVIVVTNDRALASACRATGAATMSWDTFDQRSRQSRRLPGGPTRKAQAEPPVKIEDWQKFFGIPDADLED